MLSLALTHVVTTAPITQRSQSLKMDDTLSSVTRDFASLIASEEPDGHDLCRFRKLELESTSLKKLLGKTVDSPDPTRQGWCLC